MKETKFRLRNWQNRIVGYEKWYSGNFNTEGHYYVAKPQWLYSVDNEKWKPRYILHRYKDQYTGLKDKNGKEIYEEDIIKDHNALGVIVWDIENDEKPVGIGIKWIDENIPEGVFGSIWVEDLNDYKVIGNIHENPELIGE